MNQYPQVLDYYKICELLPYRSPWLLIDRLLGWEEKRITVQKVVSGADPMVAAHFPNGPSVIPGVLHIELVSQAILLLGKLTAASTDSADGSGATITKTTVLARCKADFFSPGFIGDSLIAEVVIHDVIAGKTMYEGVIKCGERLVCKVTGIAASFEGTLNSMPG